MENETDQIYLYRHEPGAKCPPGFKRLAPCVIASESRFWPVLTIQEAAELEVSIHWIKRAYPEFDEQCKNNRPKP